MQCLTYLEANKARMQLKIFTGLPANIQTEANEWLQQNKQRIQQTVQSQSNDAGGNVIITLTFLFEEPTTGTGLGFRRNL